MKTQTHNTNKFEFPSNQTKQLISNETMDCLIFWVANVARLQTFHASINPFKTTHAFIQLNEASGKNLELGIKIINLSIGCPLACGYGGILAAERVLVPEYPPRPPKSQSMH